MTPDWQDIATRLAEALSALRCEQNGPPLLRRENDWQDAMQEANAALNEFYEAEAEDATEMGKD